MRRVSTARRRAYSHSIFLYFSSLSFLCFFLYSSASLYNSHRSFSFFPSCLLSISIASFLYNSSGFSNLFYLCSFRFYIKLLVPRRSTKFFTILSFLIVALSPLFLRIIFVQFVSQIFSFLSFFIFFIFLSNLSNLCFTNWIRSRKVPIPCSVFTIVVLRCDFLFLEL